MNRRRFLEIFGLGVPAAAALASSPVAAAVADQVLGDARVVVKASTPGPSEAPTYRVIRGSDVRLSVGDQVLELGTGLDFPALLAETTSRALAAGYDSEPRTFLELSWRPLQVPD